MRSVYYIGIFLALALLIGLAGPVSAAKPSTVTFNLCNPAPGSTLCGPLMDYTLNMYSPSVGTATTFYNGNLMSPTQNMAFSTTTTVSGQINSFVVFYGYRS